MHTVESILKTKEKPTNIIEPSILVIEALQKLISVNLSYLIVFEGDEFKGIFSERDYTRNLVLKGRSSRDTYVQEVMTTDLPVVSLTDTVEDCMYRMNVRGARYLLVFYQDRFLGVVTIHDLLRQVIANKEDVFDHRLTQELLDNDESGVVY